MANTRTHRRAPAQAPSFLPNATPRLAAIALTPQRPDAPGYTTGEPSGTTQFGTFVLLSAMVRPRGTARRDAILDAVISVVADSGLDGVTHRRVAATAGLPLASTTYWFTSREEMLTAALSAAAEHDIARLRRAQPLAPIRPT